MNLRECGLCGCDLEEDDVHWCYECFYEQTTPGTEFVEEPKESAQLHFEYHEVH